MWNCSGFCFLFFLVRCGLELVVYSKFLYPYPCDGHHRAFQLDPGLEGDIEEWEGGFHHLRFFDPVVVLFCFFLSCVCATQEQLFRKEKAVILAGCEYLAFPETNQNRQLQK